MVVTACHVYRRHRHYGRDRFPAAEFISFSGDLDFAALDIGHGARFTNSSQGAHSFATRVSVRFSQVQRPAMGNAVIPDGSISFAFAVVRGGSEPSGRYLLWR